MVVGCLGLCAACWTLGRFRQFLLRATAQAGEAAEKVDGIIVVAALDNKARDMFALILGMRMVGYGILIVDGSSGEDV